MLSEVVNQVTPAVPIFRGRDNGFVPEGMENRRRRGQLAWHEAEFNEGPHSCLQQSIVDLINVRKVVSRIALGVFLVDSNTIVQDVMETHILELSDFFHCTRIAAIVVTQSQNGPTRTKNALPVVRKGMSRSAQVYLD